MSFPPKPEPVKWQGSEKCDFCKANVTAWDWFVDGKTIYGPWALMCQKCFKQKGTGLGLGIGQKFDSKTKQKVEG